MDLLALLSKEAIAVRRNLGLVVVLLILIPGALAGGTVVFEQTIPQDVPVGLVAEGDASSDEVDITRAGITAFSTPETYDSSEEATEALQREEVYIVVHVPGDLMEPGSEANYTVTSDRAFVPFEEPVNESAGVIESEFDSSLPADVAVESEGIGEERSLSEFLVPTGLFAFVALYGLVYLPYQLHSERLVLDRLQTESRLETVVASKLLFYGLLLVVPVGVITAVTSWLGYSVAAFSPMALGVVALTFVLLASTGLAVLFLLKLRKTALFVNLGLTLGVFALSSLVYPVGFFSSTQTTISRALPTHYSAITLRSALLRDTPPSVYADYLLWLAGSAGVSLIVLLLTIALYRRRR
ncbi:ABC transporter permease [Halostagnicola sp. A-GB9-2]|uniref:ABC transporter permease n=1 Tax=Halostagnicola sp. A-GB9-2 TaxID=3048066 RepID=UPI0024BFC5E2|nr:ABC transporter permease [Halostagnicola sp. A-GB9-2]MDJ1432478.1 ABC transporter permease [Halostagnicola sp. A-GB9-2]